MLLDDWINSIEDMDCRLYVIGLMWYLREHMTDEDINKWLDLEAHGSTNRIHLQTDVEFARMMMEKVFIMVTGGD